MDLLHSLFSNVWAVFLIVLFFGGSIFVHELGHFLAARWRGLKVERFSIGFGPRVFGWKGRDGVDYRLSLLPLGGYVALPQLADLKGVEGDSAIPAETLPPISYADRMIVSVAGAVFNMAFAFFLATLLWFLGQPSSAEQATTRVGYVSPTIELADGSRITSPAVEAGLQIGDTVRAIDGVAVNDWQELMQTLVTGSELALDGRRKAIFTVERDGARRDITVYPRLAGDERIRRVGIAPAYELIVHAVNADSHAARAGVRPKDRIAALDGTPILNLQTYLDVLNAKAEQPVALQVRREGTEVTLTLPARSAKTGDAVDLGMALTTDSILIHENPVRQFSGHLAMTWRTLASLVHPHSDIGISKLSGPVGIIRVFHLAAQADIRIVLWFTILVNINLAVFNLLPIPVLDGGHMLFATIGRIRGRALPANFIAATQSVFVVLLFTMILYVSFFDVRRIARDLRPAEPPPATAPAR
ncbi:MAG: RIP metalloprotease RseP [Verrucomicrobia bacterium]|nr:RIP metalloprotease RseP [Verrucomicrobiota bacterium]